MTSRLVPALLLIALMPGRARAAADSGLPGEYLGNAGYRAAGMGRAYTAVAEGPEAVLWNPAGLGFNRPNSIAFSRAMTADGFTLDSVFYAQPVFKRGSVGVAYVRLHSGLLDVTDSLNRPIGDYSDLQQTAAAGYGRQLYQARSGRRLLQRLAAGVSVKNSRQAIYTAKADGWGADAGLLAKLKYNLSAGIKVQNLVQPELKFETATDTFPRIFTAGLAAGLWQDRLVLAADVSKTQGPGQKPRLNFGVDGEPARRVRLRAGFDASNKETLLGLSYSFGRTDASYASNLTQAGVTHNAGFSHEFGGFPVVISASPDVFSPIGLRKYAVFTVRTRPDLKVFSWTVYIRDQNGKVARSFSGNAQPPAELTWDGTMQGGFVVAAGSYFYTMEVTLAEGAREVTQPQALRVVYNTPLDRLVAPSK
jgi:hypothetical protein